MSQELDALLDRALADRALSRDERRALVARLVQGRSDPRTVRDRAFASVARRLGPEARSFLEWLEDVVELTADPRFLAEVHESPSEEAWQRIVELVGAAQDRIDVCVFTITDDRISSALFHAHRRGVVVRIVSDDEKSDEPGSDVRRLMQSGLSVRLDASVHHMHHKFALFDGATVLSGSYNWTRAAAEANQDNFLVTDEPRIVRGYQAIFDRAWERAR